MSIVSLPTNDLSFGLYPQRDSKAVSPGVLDRLRLWFAGRTPDARLPEEGRQALAKALRQARRMSKDELTAQAVVAGHRLRSEGLAAPLVGKALGLTAESLHRTLGLRPYETQLNAAWQMLHGNLIEMQTGEGKTIAAALTAAVAALAGSTVYVLTANDYLVRRDHDALSPFFEALRLSCGWVGSQSDSQQRQLNWRRDVVFSSARELGFDYLRDHVRLEGQRDPVLARTRALELASTHSPVVGNESRKPLVPGLCFCIVDEADSLLLDEAIMPLIIARPGDQAQAQAYRDVFALAGSLHQLEHFDCDSAARKALLTPAGREAVSRKIDRRNRLFAVERRVFEWVQTALAAQHLYARDRDYALVDGQVTLIDELTGRLAQGRQWQGLLHQMVEIKEGLEPSSPSQVSAQITYQTLFPRFNHLCGMSGTLSDDSRELFALYGRPVVRIALRTPGRRIASGFHVSASTADKWKAVVEAIQTARQQGRPVLVGNDSVEDSNHLSGLLNAAGIKHQVLNATQSAAEAACLARAGRSSVVTVTTNIAGRGTDIRLSEAARRAGGLHVIATMLNRSRRIDRQLWGRSARQGDPGSYQVFVSCEDRLLARTWPASLRRLFARGCAASAVNARWHQWPFMLARRLEERRDRAIRSALRDAARVRQSQFGFTGHFE